jgi:hypothetical protein
MKHLEVIDLSAPAKSEQSDFDLVLEELEERREFSGMLPVIPGHDDPGDGCWFCCGPGEFTPTFVGCP